MCATKNESDFYFSQLVKRIIEEIRNNNNNQENKIGTREKMLTNMQREINLERYWDFDYTKTLNIELLDSIGV